MITGAPGVRKQYASDFVIGDYVLGKGYAYASTDKGNTGTAFYEDGAEPGDAIAEWNRRVTELAVAAKETVARRYGRAAARTYVTGISNGGYLTRWQLENRPDLYDGGVDWEGTLFDSTPGLNLLSFLPPALKHYPRYRATGDQAAHDAIIAAGLRARLGVPLGRPLRRLLGPHPAHLPRGARPGLGRRDRGGHAVLPVRHAELRRRLRLRLAAGLRAGGRSTRSPTRAGSASRC